jgi:hypothetical protein
MDSRRLIDQGSGLVRGTVRIAGRVGKGVAVQVWGLAQKAGAARAEPKDLDDVTLARKVETEVFRGADAPKSKVNVNVVDGVVELRGEVKRPAHVKAIEGRVRAIPEVKGVENLLHLPKTPARTRTDAPPSQRKTATPKRQGAAARQRRTRKVSDDQTDRVVEAEPSPKELADERKGRQAAPLGSQGEDEQGNAQEPATESTSDPSVSPTGTS